MRYHHYPIELENGSKFGVLQLNILNANNIVYDAEARHQTFMDILRGKYSKINIPSVK